MVGLRSPEVSVGVSHASITKVFFQEVPLCWLFPASSIKQHELFGLQGIVALADGRDTLFHLLWGRCRSVAKPACARAFARGERNPLRQPRHRRGLHLSGTPSLATGLPHSGFATRPTQCTQESERWNALSKPFACFETS